MSEDTQAAIVIGLPWSDFDENDPLEAWVDNEVLERFAPYYDAPSEFCVYGIKYKRTEDYDEFNYIITTIIELMDKFKEITGKDGKQLLVLDVS